MDHRSFLARSLVHFASANGSLDVLGVEDDADHDDRSSTADDDEDHAHHYGWHFYRFAHLERPCRVYSDEQPGGNWAAVVSKSLASASGGAGEADQRKEVNDGKWSNAVSKTSS